MSTRLTRFISAFMSIALLLSTALTPMSINAGDVHAQTVSTVDFPSATPDLPINDQIIDEESRAPICGPVVTHSGTITSNTVWNAGYVHVLDSDVTVNAGVTLQIDSGAVVKAKRLTSLTVNGRLLAVGTEAFPVYFTSWHDDNLCGDTNGNGTGSVPAPDDWGWLAFGSGSDATSTIRRAVIRYGGYDYFLDCCVLRL